jgi:AcrR family transcriptional regulator
MPAAGSSERSDQRRRALLEAAVTCFARKGLYGTTTAEIAEAAGISQPYIYRLFVNKEALFAGAVLHVSELMSNTLATCDTSESVPAQPEIALRAVRHSSLIQDRDIMRLLMHANCAADEPMVRDAVQECYASQVSLVSELLRSDEDAVRAWFGSGMLSNVAAVLGLPDVDEPWARVLSA